LYDNHEYALLVAHLVTLLARKARALLVIMLRAAPCMLHCVISTASCYVCALRCSATELDQWLTAATAGFHLSPKDTAARIEPTIADIVAMQPQLVVAGHCTGWQVCCSSC
jgi:hypothetical protein